MDSAMVGGWSIAAPRCARWSIRSWPSIYWALFGPWSASSKHCGDGPLGRNGRNWRSTKIQPLEFTRSINGGCLLWILDSWSLQGTTFCNILHHFNCFIHLLKETPAASQEVLDKLYGVARYEFLPETHSHFKWLKSKLKGLQFKLPSPAFMTGLAASP